LSLDHADAVGTRIGEPIRLQSLTKSFTSRRGVVRALDSVELDIAAGEFVTLIGPSGCGKSTLLRLVGGLLQPDDGEIRVGARSPGEARGRKSFGFVPQTPALLPWQSVIDNVSLLRKVNRAATSASALPDAMELLEVVGLATFAKAMPHELSGGMQQRVALVRAFALGAPVLLMDEPFAALDEITRRSMRYLLLDVWERSRATVLFVTHSIDEAVILSDRVVVLTGRPGRIASIVPTPLPRPRHEDVEDSEQFHQHTHDVRVALRAGFDR